MLILFLYLCLAVDIDGYLKTYKIMINFKATVTKSQLILLHDYFHTLFIKLSEIYYLNFSEDSVLLVRLDVKSCDNIRNLVFDFLDEYKSVFETQDYDSVCLLREFINAMLFTFK